MSVSRRSLYDALVSVGALAAVAVGAAAWSQDGVPHVSTYALITLGGAAVLALIAGAFVRESTARDATPVIAGVCLAILGIDHSADLLRVLPPWAIAVVVGYRVLVGPFISSLPRAAVVVLAGVVLTVIVPLADWGHAPYDRVVAGLVAFALAHALLEWLRPGDRASAFGRRAFVLACAGVVYAAGLVLVVEQIKDFSDDPWPAVAVSAIIGLGGVAVAQFGRIAMLARVTEALTEASITTPWPADLIDDTLIRLVSDHVRAADISVEARSGGPDTLSEQIHSGSVLVIRREPGDVSFSRYDARLVAGLAAMARASHAQAARESQLRVATVTDELTGLWEYEHWRDELRDVSRTRGGRERIGVVFLDLDHFKQVNTEFGHLRADQLLTAIGGRLQDQSPQWRFGRFGGDEFVGLARNVRDEAHLDDLCRGLAAIVRQPVETDGLTISVTASIGRVLSAVRTETADVILARAEKDLRERKAARHFPMAPIVEVNEEEIIRRLIDHGVDVAYQPIIDVKSLELVGWEALLRGSLPLLGTLNPEELVGSAVRAGVMDIVTRQLAKQAISTSAEAARRVNRRLSLSINLEQEQFRPDSPLIAWVIEQAGIAPVDLVLELTERGSIDHWDTAEDGLATLLEEHGIGLALDDFGAGGNRIPLLVRRDWHTVKLDRSFLLGGARALTLLGHTVRMLRSLDLTVVMEGVETAEQLALVEGLGVDHVQGHYFAPAGTAEEVLAFIDRYGVDFSQARTREGDVMTPRSPA
ncbi:bifunctional diguanylate cyclase/phosphodiesterase [Nocardioides sp. Kera G14]|uniref:bifunctional diguanylate cyclase/phosphodiesterase n=1 Tax=Nocardioides sp. Kera G14 TaxID=2884264 RepID=UPI001D10158E|nr:bifunctional diguanylate cyclase/phosphodiesterase [Nocardioides sp. Kera G14]UDY25148.1 bifunctional diguanylate cyclase/phosphodiesterase [Nocardioides sp. Kera G14]